MTEDGPGGPGRQGEVDQGWVSGAGSGVWGQRDGVRGAGREVRQAEGPGAGTGALVLLGAMGR